MGWAELPRTSVELPQQVIDELKRGGGSQYLRRIVLDYMLRKSSNQINLEGLTAEIINYSTDNRNLTIKLPRQVVEGLDLKVNTIKVKV